MKTVKNLLDFRGELQQDLEVDKNFALKNLHLWSKKFGIKVEENLVIKYSISS